MIKIDLSNGCTTNKLIQDLLIDFVLKKFDNSMICKIYHEWVYIITRSTSFKSIQNIIIIFYLKILTLCLNKLSWKEKIKGQECRKSHIYFKIDNKICRSILNEHKFFLKKEICFNSWLKCLFKIEVEYIEKTKEYIFKNIYGVLTFERLWSFLHKLED